MTKHLLSLLVFLAALYLLLTRPAHADEPAGIIQCTTLASDYSRNPFALSVGQLDTLRLCISEQIAATVQASQDERTGRAIERSFWRDAE